VDPAGTVTVTAAAVHLPDPAAQHLVDLAAYPALGDPLNGHNATPGTLTCGGITHPTTSGSGHALAIQLTDGSGVFVVKEVPGFGIAVGGGIPEGNLQTCVLIEPSLGNIPITVIGILTSTR